MNKELSQWYKATDSLAKAFADKYFREDKDDDLDTWWVADDIGGVYHVNSYFFGVDYMVAALKYEATLDQILDYQDLEIESFKNKKTLANFKNFIKYGFTYV